MKELIKIVEEIDGLVQGSEATVDEQCLIGTEIDQLKRKLSKLCSLPVVRQWVDIKAKEPKNETKQYLVIRKGEVMVETWIYDNQGYWYDYCGITHWMEIPPVA